MSANMLSRPGHKEFLRSLYELGGKATYHEIVTNTHCGQICATQTPRQLYNLGLIMKGPRQAIVYDSGHSTYVQTWILNVSKEELIRLSVIPEESARERTN